MQPALTGEGPYRRERPDLLLEPSLSCSKLLLLGDMVAARRILAPVLALPERTNQIARTHAVAVCLGLRPDQCLLLLESDEGIERVREGLLRGALDAVHALDAGARFVGFALVGKRAAALLNSGCGLDLRLKSMPPDTCAGSRIEQVPVWILRHALETFEVLVERPLAAYLWQWLNRAAETL